uniref:DUF4371 domain-containing protein n=1 Tax=Trichogramma kaykai TaxID=54128 RepID=A0ABD2WDM7_9HYME
MMSSKKSVRIYHYQEKWEKESWAKGWLVKAEPIPVNGNQAWCKVCRKDFRAHATDLKKHANTPTHSTLMDSIHPSKQKTIVSMNSVATSNSKNDKIRDITIAAFIACHASFRTMDHLCDVLKATVPGMSDFKMHRTKCSNVINNVIAPNVLLDLISDIGKMPFSLIVDESTDVSVHKYMCICIKYFSVAKKKIVTNYLGIIQLDRADAQSLYDALVEYAETINLQLSQMIGIGTDGGSNMCGKDKSLFALLKKTYPKLQLVRCICHALNNASSAAGQAFPDAVDFLCHQIYTWFSNSSVRRSDYKLTWDTLNECANETNANDNKKDFYNFVKLAATRWLSRYNVVRVILHNYDELEAHFISVCNSKDKSHIARQILVILQDYRTYFYLLIVTPILGEINDLNISFQKNNVDLGLAYEDLKNFILFLASKIMKPSFIAENKINVIINAMDNDLAFLHATEIDCGVEYQLALQTKNINNEMRKEVQYRAFNYIKSLCQELCTRVPTNLEFYYKLSAISPKTCLSKERPAFMQLPFVKELIPRSLLGRVESQYAKLITIDLRSKLSEEELTDSNKFWVAT